MSVFEERRQFGGACRKRPFKEIEGERPVAGLAELQTFIIDGSLALWKEKPVFASLDQLPAHCQTGSMAHAGSCVQSNCLRLYCTDVRPIRDKWPFCLRL